MPNELNQVQFTDKSGVTHVFNKGATAAQLTGPWPTVASIPAATASSPSSIYYNGEKYDLVDDGTKTLMLKDVALNMTEEQQAIFIPEIPSDELNPFKARNSDGDYIETCKVSKDWKVLNKEFMYIEDKDTIDAVLKGISREDKLCSFYDKDDTYYSEFLKKTTVQGEELYYAIQSFHGNSMWWPHRVMLMNISLVDTLNAITIEIDTVNTYNKWVDYIVNYVSEFGEVPATLEHVVNLPEELPILTAEGYTFDGWFEDPSYQVAAVPGVKLYHNVTLYAKWTKIEEEQPVESAEEPNQVEETPIEETPVTEEGNEENKEESSEPEVANDHDQHTGDTLTITENY